MKHTLLITALAFSGSNVLAQPDPVPYFNVDAEGLWVDGYDPVAYVVDRKALKGKPEYALAYKSATFRFTTRTHLELFRLEPEKYLPMYGGYCAYAIGANNAKVEVDPETFKVIDGKLFLFYNAFFNNTLTAWNKDEGRLHRAADLHWSAFKHATQH